MKIAVLLPTRAPELAVGAIDSFAHALRAFPDSEIVVVSQAPVAGPKVRWVAEGDQLRGVNAAQSIAYAATDADVVIAGSDYVRMRPDAVERAIAFLLENEPATEPYLLGLNFIQPAVFPFGTLGTVYGFYYPYFPMARRYTVAAAGGWYDPVYRGYWGDSDLALRVWHAPGGRCEMTPGCIDLVAGRDGLDNAAGRLATLERDMVTFRARWESRLGRGWGPTMRDFNIDLRPHAPLLDGLRRDDVQAVQEMVRAKHRQPLA